MATDSSVLAWRIPGMGEPGGLPSMGSHRVGHDWSDLAAAAAAAAAAVAVNPGGNQPWIFTGRTIAGAEAPMLWPPDGKSWLIGKDPDAGKDWKQKEKGTTDDEMVTQHYWLNEYELGQTLGDTEQQESLACCSPWGCRVRQNLVIEQQ